MTVMHIVLFEFKPTASQERVKQVRLHSCRDLSNVYHNSYPGTHY